MPPKILSGITFPVVEDDDDLRLLLTEFYLNWRRALLEKLLRMCRESRLEAMVDQSTLDFLYNADTVNTVAHVLEVLGRFSCMP